MLNWIRRRGRLRSGGRNSPLCNGQARAPLSKSLRTLAWSARTTVPLLFLRDHAEKCLPAQGLLTTPAARRTAATYSLNWVYTLVKSGQPASNPDVPTADDPPGA